METRQKVDILKICINERPTRRLYSIYFKQIFHNVFFHHFINFSAVGCFCQICFHLVALDIFVGV